MLQKPAPPFGPVIVNDKVVVLEDWYDAIEALDNCELVTFPLMTRLTFESLSVVAGTVVADGVGVGDEVGVGEGEVMGLGVEVGAGGEVVVGEGEGVEVGANVAEMVVEA